MRVEFARRFTKDCHELGIVIHGTFILGLPGETRETIQQTLDFAKEINPHTIQVSPRWPPIRALSSYRQPRRTVGSTTKKSGSSDEGGYAKLRPLNYPHLSHGEIFNSVDDFYRKFYFRATKIASIVAEMIARPEMMKRRLREGVEFYRFLRTRHDPPWKCLTGVATLIAVRLGTLGLSVGTAVMSARGTIERSTNMTG